MSFSMANEQEKKETELSRNRFGNDGQRRTLHAIEAQVERERRKRKENEYAIRRIKNDLLAEFADLSDPKRVKAAVTRLNDKYVHQDNVKNIYATNEPNDGISEEAIAQDRQRLYLERTTADLKHKLSNDLHATKANRMRIMNENAMLLSELNHLRGELKIIRDRITDYDVAKQTADGRGIHGIDALIQTLHADSGNYAARHRDQELIKEVEKNQREIQRLRQRLANAEQTPSPSPDRDYDDELEDVSILRLA